MTLRKITFDNSVKYIVKIDHSHVSNEGDMRKKNVSKKPITKEQKIFKNKTAEGFVLEKLNENEFLLLKKNIQIHLLNKQKLNGKRP